MGYLVQYKITTSIETSTGAKENRSIENINAV